VRGAYQEARHEHHDEDKGLASGIALLWRDRVMRRMTIAWFVFVLGMGMGMVADAALAEHFGTGAVGFAALIACWGSGSVIGSGLGRYLKPATEPLWIVVGSFGIAAAAFGVGFAPVFVLVLISLFAMGAADGLTMVAETGIMQRRTPDVLRSRTMAAFEAVVSLGLAAAYLMAGPVLKVLGPQATYRLGGLSALAAALVLLPLLALRRDDGPGGGASALHVGRGARDGVGGGRATHGLRWGPGGPTSATAGVRARPILRA